jgi:hypothetical protein
MEHSKSVATWLESYDNPMKDVVRRVREIILRADPRIEESLEGNSPTFSYRGTLVSIFPESKKHASLMIPQGGEIPGHHPRLEGSEGTRRVMKIASPSEANAARDDLQHLVRAWCDWRDAEGAGEEEAPAEAAETGAPTKRAAKKKATEPAAKKAKKASKPAAKKSAGTTKASKPAAKKASGSAAKKSGKPAAKKAQRPPTRKAAKPASTKGRGGRRGS